MFYIFDNAIEKMLHIFLSEIDMKTGNDCRKISYRDNKLVVMHKRSLRLEKLTYEFIKMTSTFAFMYVDQVNNFADIKSFKYIFDTHRKNIDFTSHNLNIVKFYFK